MQLAESQLGRPLEDYLRELYVDQHLSLRDIGARMGLDVGTISRWMRQLGIATRPAGRHRS